MDRRILLAVMLAVTLRPALAQSDASLMPEGSSDMHVGAMLANVPTAPGSERRSTILLPQISAEWSNGFFLDGLTLGKQLSSSPVLKYGPLLALDLAAQHGESGSALRPVVGAFVRYLPMRELRLQATVLVPASRSGGVLLRVSAGSGMALRPHQSMGFGIGISVADSAYMRSDFGTAHFRPSGGLRDLFAEAHWDWEITPKVKVVAGLYASQLQGDAAASPRTRQRVGMADSLAFSYSF